MKIYSVALTAIALLNSPAKIHAKFMTSSSLDDQTPTFSSPFNDNGDNNRYIIKYKSGSRTFRARMRRAQREKAAGRVMSSSPNDELLKFGSFLPDDNSEVLLLNSQDEVKTWSEKDDVEYVELDTKMYLQNEQTPYGINIVKALEVDDSLVSNRKVCIMDTGYDITHPDLTSDPNVVTGYTGNLGQNTGNWYEDGHGHGTHVAGTIAAIGGNNKGVVGVNRNGQIKLHIVKVFNNNGSWAWGSDVVAAARICVDAGANIVSMSLGGGGYSQAADDAYKSILLDDDVLLVAAAGNGGNTSYLYPASYNYVMSVAATDSSNNLAGFSQRNDQVDIAAPGVGVLSTLPSSVASSGYAAWSGTSMATPHVSGVAALVWSYDTSKSANEIRLLLQASAQDLGAAGRDDSYGHGLVRADRAKNMMDGFTMPPTVSPTPAPPCDDDPVDWYDSDGPVYDCEWYAQGSNCAAYGNGYANFGKTANEACCACGGGKKPEEGPTASPTNSPTASPTENPTASPTESDDGVCPQGQSLLRIEVETDSRGWQNFFFVRQRNARRRFRKLVWRERKFASGSTLVFDKCLPKDECYKVFMIDKGRDGMCCEFGEGGHIVTWDNIIQQNTLDNKSFTHGRKSVSKQFGTC